MSGLAEKKVSHNGADGYQEACQLDSSPWVTLPGLMLPSGLFLSGRARVGS